MILNTYAVLDGLLVALRLLLGLLVLGLAGFALWKRRAPVPLERRAHEDRLYLLFLMAILLLALNVASWPLYYLLLQSYVPQWPGVMCIYGVTQVGKGSIGTSRFLPDLVTALQVAKPLLVFVSGGWFAMYLLNRRTATAPLAGRLLWTLQFLGFLAAADAAVEGAYLVIPKKEEFLSTGCCTEAFDATGRASRFLPAALFGEGFHPWLYAGYFGIHLLLILSLWAYVRGNRARPSIQWLSLLLLGAVLAVPISGAFLIEIAAPKLLHLPYHHCPYDLLPKAPESVLGVALFFLGTFGAGWALWLGCFGQTAETAPFLEATIKKVLGLGLLGYLGSLLMFSLELALNWS